MVERNCEFAWIAFWIRKQDGAPTLWKGGRNLCVSPVIECVDVDGVVRSIDVNDVVERIDVDSLLERIDINHHMERLDVDAIMSRVDVNKLVLRSDLASIVAQSSTGVFSAILDSLRIHIVSLDLEILKWCKCGQEILPPAPGKVDLHVSYPPTAMEKAIAVRRHYCGFFSKAIAMFIDLLLISVCFALFILIIEVLYRFFIKDDAHINRDKLWVVIVSAFVWFCYFWLGVCWTSQTFGMAIVGVKVVDVSGGSVSLWRGAIRTVILPINFVLFFILGLIGAFRRDGRMIQDLVAGTGMIWKWNARIARLRNESLTGSSHV